MEETGPLCFDQENLHEATSVWARETPAWRELWEAREGLEVRGGGAEQGRCWALAAPRLAGLIHNSAHFPPVYTDKDANRMSQRGLVHCKRQASLYVSCLTPAFSLRLSHLQLWGTDGQKERLKKGTEKRSRGLYRSIQLM